MNSGRTEEVCRNEKNPATRYVELFLKQSSRNEEAPKKVGAKTKKAPLLLGALLRRQRAEVVQLMFFVPCR